MIETILRKIYLIIVGPIIIGAATGGIIATLIRMMTMEYWICAILMGALAVFIIATAIKIIIEEL